MHVTDITRQYVSGRRVECYTSIIYLMVFNKNCHITGIYQATDDILIATVFFRLHTKELLYLLQYYKFSVILILRRVKLRIYEQYTVTK